MEVVRWKTERRGFSKRHAYVGDDKQAKCGTRIAQGVDLSFGGVIECQECLRKSAIDRAQEEEERANNL